MRCNRKFIEGIVYQMLVISSSKDDMINLNVVCKYLAKNVQNFIRLIFVTDKNLKLILFTHRPKAFNCITYRTLLIFIINEMHVPSVFDISNLIGANFLLKFFSMSEDILHNQNNNQFDENNASIGSASTLRRAMTVTKIDEMLQCISDMKLYANTIEQDLPDYLNTVGITSNNEMSIAEIHPEDLIEQAQQRSNDDRYILLRDLIKSSKVYR